MVNKDHLTENNRGIFNQEYSPFILVMEVMPWLHGDTGDSIYCYRIVDTRHAKPEDYLGSVTTGTPDDGDTKDWLYGFTRVETPTPPEYMIKRLRRLSSNWEKINSRADYERLFKD